jgi:hypothetical protein
VTNEHHAADYVNRKESEPYGGLILEKLHRAFLLSKRNPMPPAAPAGSSENFPMLS